MKLKNNEVLQALKAELTTTQISIDVSMAKAMFERHASEYDGFDKACHQYFFDEYFPKHEAQITKAVGKIAASYDDVLISDFIGKLANKLPIPYVPGNKEDYSVAKATMTIAGIIGHILMDTGEVKSKIEVKKVGARWETLTHLYFGGEELKELVKGLHFEPGKFYQKKTVGGHKLNRNLKDLGKEIASCPLRLSDVATKELIWKGYTLKKDWNKRKDANGNALKEDHNDKVERYEEYADVIMALQEKIFYLELKYSDSGRMFYKLQLEGMRPQGKLWETLMIDSGKYYYITEEQQMALKHLIYCTIEGEKVSPERAVELFKETHLDTALAMLPMEAESEDEFGEWLLLNKAGKALELARAGKPCNYMFGWDFTTSGIIMAGMSFHSEEMMTCGNVYGDEVVHDTYTQFIEAFGINITRKQAKSLVTPILHGSSLNTLVKNMRELTHHEYTEEFVFSHLKDSYGEAVENLMTIAEWGTQIVNNYNTQVHWTMPDGFKATHKAYYEKAEVKITCVSCHEKHKKNGRTTHTLSSDMPLYFDNKGRVVSLKSAAKYSDNGRAAVKNRGLYANITHSIDAYVLRQVVAELDSQGFSYMLKHDDYMVSPAAFEVVREAAAKAFSKLYDNNIYISAMNEIMQYADNNAIAPTVIYGEAENRAEQSVSFLMP